LEPKQSNNGYSRFAQINQKFSKGRWSVKENKELLYYISKYGKNGQYCPVLSKQEVVNR